MGDLILAGDENNEDQALSTANVNHLRRLLAWIVCEFNLSEVGQVGLLIGLNQAVQFGADQRRGQEILDSEVAKIQRVPAYVRQAVKMLQKAIREHEVKTKVISG